jgi:hypothetical protein
MSLVCITMEYTVDHIGNALVDRIRAEGVAA